MPRPKLCSECDTPESCLAADPVTYTALDGTEIRMLGCYRSPKSWRAIEVWYHGRISGHPSPYGLTGAKLEWLVALLNAKGRDIGIPTTGKPLKITLRAEKVETQPDRYKLMVPAAYADEAWKAVDTVSGMSNDDPFFDSVPYKLGGDSYLYAASDRGPWSPIPVNPADVRTKKGRQAVEAQLKAQTPPGQRLYRLLNSMAVLRINPAMIDPSRVPHDIMGLIEGVQPEGGGVMPIRPQQLELVV